MDIYNELKDILIKKAKGFYYTEETVEFTENAAVQRVQVKETGEHVHILGLRRKRGRPPKNLIKSVTYLQETEKSGVDLSQGMGEKDADKRENSVVKRKIATHYVPPDMLAIKMLFENFGEKVDSEQTMSDEELVSLKKKYLKELGEYEDK